MNAENYIGETNIANNGQIMKIVVYRRCDDIDVEFEDGTVVEHKSYASFQRGQIKNPNYFSSKRIGEVNIATNEQKMKIRAYRNYNDIDIEFEDGTIVEHKTYGSFKKGEIANPNYKNYKNNSLKTWCEQNNNPLLNEWDYEKNNALGIYPDKITYGTLNKVWWICSKGHSYDMRVMQKTNGNNNCPICSGKRIKKGINDFQSQYPELLKDWNWEKNIIKPDEITCFSGQKVWWKCSKCKNEWKTAVCNRSQIGTGCPICARKNARLKRGKNDLASQYPDLMKEWDFEKNTIKPDEVARGSIKKVWWKCSKCGNSWCCQVNSRTQNNGTNCPKCSKYKRTSFPEQALYYYIKQIFPDAINSDNHLGMEFDIYIPSLDVAIEYDGEAWHNTKNQIQRDLRKNQLCIDNNIELIRVREPKCAILKNCTVFNRKDTTNNLSLDIVISDVLRYLTSSITVDVDTTRDTPMILSQYATKKYKNSLAYCYPDIAKEWHPTKNGKLTPDKVTKRANRKIWWKCLNGHDYQMCIDSRTRQNQSCPYCNHRRILIGTNDLQSQYPKIAEEWHPTKNNGITPDKVTQKSKQKVWWLGKCGHEWQMCIVSRTRLNQGCPICFKKKRCPSVICIETNERFENGVLASKFANLKTTSGIYRCCKGEKKHNTAGGYHWKFAIYQ